jgi:hypothetical protein
MNSLRNTIFFVTSTALLACSAQISPEYRGEPLFTSGPAWIRRASASKEGARSTTTSSAETPSSRAPRAMPSKEDGYLAILSVDGNGKASIYYPTTPDAAPVKRNMRQPLPLSTRLDDSLGRETIHAYLCRSAVELEALRAALEAHPPEAPRREGCTVETLVFEKRARP